MVKRVKSAGNPAVPTLLRALRSSNELEARWSYYLLSRLGGRRVIDGLEHLLRDDVPDDIKARAMGLLTDLRAPMPRSISLRNPEKLLANNVNQLLASLDTTRELKDAIKLVLTQVPEPEMTAFVAELVRHGGRRAVPLISGVLAEGAMRDETRDALLELQRQARVSAAERTMQLTLSRGLEYLEAGKPRAARRRLERYVHRHPDRAEGQSALGICLLELGDNDRAIMHLSEAARIEPHEPLHRWNVASAAKQADRLGGCYLALRDYLSLADEHEGHEERRDEARSFIRAYERMLRGVQPGVPLGDVLRGEELFARAYAALGEGLHGEAAAGFEEVLALVPRHYPSWGNLGACYLALGRTIEAQRCFERALELNPDYKVARHNLELLHQSR